MAGQPCFQSSRSRVTVQANINKRNTPRGGRGTLTLTTPAKIAELLTNAESQEEALSWRLFSGVLWPGIGFS